VEYGLVPFPGVPGGLEYVMENGHLLLGLLAYGLVQTICLSLLLVASALWFRKTAALIMFWATLFVFLPLLGVILVERLNFDTRWRLMDQWSNMNLVGRQLLGLEQTSADFLVQPAWLEGALVLGGVCVLCLIYLVPRIRAVEVVN